MEDINDEDLKRGHVFAVVDGSQFDDMQGVLHAKKLTGRSLYRQHTDHETMQAGPWLVPIRDEAGLGEVVSLTSERSAAIYWNCPDGEEVLHRHLRTISALRMPDGGTALFRYYDPRVLETALAVFTPQQRARFLGPANSISGAHPAATDSPCSLRREQISASHPQMEDGAIVLSEEQLGEMDVLHACAFLQPDILEYARIRQLNWSKDEINESVRWALAVRSPRSGMTMGDVYNIAIMHREFGVALLTETRLIDFLRQPLFPVSVVADMAFNLVRQAALNDGAQPRRF